MRGADELSTAELVRPLLFYGFMAWLGVGVLETAATATLIDELGASKIPSVNLVGAALTAMLGLGYAALHRSGRDGSRALGVVVALVAGVTVALALGLQVETAAGLVFAGLVLYRLTKVVMPTALWDAAGERLDIVQGKRLFGLIGATQPAGRVTAYVSAPFVVIAIGTTGLFAVAAASLTVAAISLRWARQPVGPRDHRDHASTPFLPEAAAPHSAAPPVREVLRSRMVPPLLLLWGAGTAAYTILSFSFGLAGEGQYEAVDDLAIAVAVVSAVSASLAALASLLLARGLLRRFGAAGAVAFRGLTVATGAIAVAVIAGATTATAVIFLVVAGLRIVEDVTGALAEPAIRMLGRVLPPARRAVVNAATDAVVTPAAIALASLVIIVLDAGGADTFSVLGVLIAALAAAGAATAWVIARDYREVLREALAEGRVDLQTDEIDADTVIELERVLSTGNAPAVEYALDLLAAVDPEGQPARLAALLGHPSDQVRLEVLARVEMLDLDDLVPAIRARLPTEGSAQVRGASARVVAAIAGGEALDDVMPYLRARDPAVRRGAMAGLLRSGDIEAVLAAGEPLLGLVRADDPGLRREAAFILGEGGRSGLHRPLQALLTDADPTVVEAALRAAPAVGHPRVWPLVVDQLDRLTVRAAAQRALEQGGDAALVAIAEALPRALREDRSDVAVALLSSLGRMGAGAVPVLDRELARSLAHDDRRVGDAAAASLLRLRHRCDGPEALLVEADLDRGLDAYADLLAHERAVVAGRPVAPAVTELVGLLRHRRRCLAVGLLRRWALLQDRDVAERVVAVLDGRRSVPASTEERAYAIETLETGPGRTWGRLIAAAFIEIDPVGLQGAFESRISIDLTKRTTFERVLAGAGNYDAVRAGLTLQAAADVGEPGLAVLLDAATALRHPFVVATEQQLRDRLDRAPQEAVMMTPVERMLALKSSELLADAEDDLLAEILDQVVDREVVEGDVLFTEGALPERLFLVLSGQIELAPRAGDTRVVGPGDLVGEIAVLAGTPYTATATVRQAGSILELPVPIVELLLAAEPTFSRMLLRRLARRAMHADTGHDGADDAMASILDRLVDSETP